MKALLTAGLMFAMATPALADKQAVSDAYINDHYKTVLEQTPYSVEVCRDVQVPVQGKKEMDTGGAIVGGIIGGVIGNQFGKGNGKDAMTGIGAMTGAIIGGQKEGVVGYRTERQCSVETRYKETQREVYSHSTARFTFEGRRYELKFNK